MRRLDANTVAFHLAHRYAAAERLLTALPCCPSIFLGKRIGMASWIRPGKQAHHRAKSLPLGSVSPERVCRRTTSYFGAQPLLLEDETSEKQRLPYLDEITFLFVPNADAEVIRFQSGDTDILNRLGADDYSVLKKDQATHSFRVYDAGPSLEYNFLFFNLNSALPANSDISRKQAWFRQVKFRQAISLAIDRDSMVRLIYREMATPLWSPVTPASAFWVDAAIPHPARSIDQARKLLRDAGFSWSETGELIDSSRSPVKFTILTSASNSQRMKMATIIQQDMKELGIAVEVVPLEFRSVVNRIFQTHDYEAAILGLGAGDVDPNSQMNVWLSSGNDHIWDLGESHPATAWENEIDQLMEKQLTTLKPQARKLLYDRVQEIIAENLPLISLVSPNVLVAAKNELANFKPAALDPHTLWNAPELYLTGPGASGQP